MEKAIDTFIEAVHETEKQFLILESKKTRIQKIAKKKGVKRATEVAIAESQSLLIHLATLAQIVDDLSKLENFGTVPSEKMALYATHSLTIMKRLLMSSQIKE